MKFSLTVLLLFWLGHAFGQSTITTAEYFIDTDPGFGSGTPVSVSPASSVSANFDVELSGLEPGIHFLHTRVKNSDEKWSLYSRKLFYIANISPGQTIESAEYFIDDDPGIGNATALTISAGTEISENFAIPLNDIEEGVHHLHIRVKNSQNKWSLYGRKLFYVMPEEIASDIIAAEYFIDTDPGIGNGQTLLVEPGASIAETYDINTSDTLMEGDHLLHIRVLNSAEKWSVYAVQVFEIDTDLGLDERNIAFELFPNPTSDFLTVKSTGDPIAQIRVIDMNGKIVRQLNGISNTANQIDLDNLPAGTYLVQVVDASGFGVSERVVIQ